MTFILEEFQLPVLLGVIVGVCAYVLLRLTRDVPSGHGRKSSRHKNVYFDW